MNYPEPSIRVNVDVTNPGQFFACCGLLELADRLWPGAEGWFEEEEQFCVACESSLEELLKTLSGTTINSSVGDDGLKRLGTLLSTKKSSLSTSDQEEKGRLRSMWQQETLHLGPPFDVLLDWWRDEDNERTPLKTWAAKQFVLEIVRPLLQAITAVAEQCPLNDILLRSADVNGLPLYFDSHAQCQNTAIDTGFSLYDLRTVIRSAESIKPALELFCFIGLQRFRPHTTPTDSMFRFSVWSAPLPVAVAATAVCGQIRLSGERQYAFRLLDRTKYMKAFLPATPIGDLT
ncbi:MAG: type I-U CRISPR-associated protein Cas8c [bacterium]